MRNIDIAKQWPDITREGNLGHNVLLPTGNAECEICKQNIKTKLYLPGVGQERSTLILVCRTADVFLDNWFA